MGIGCGTDGRAVASDTRDPGSSTVLSNFYKEYLFTVNLRKDENIEKEALNGPLILAEYVAPMKRTFKAVAQVFQGLASEQSTLLEVFLYGRSPVLPV